jgi:tetratricopeptide (TPR) repeat protein
MYERGDYEDAKYFAEQARSVGEELDDDAGSRGRFDVPDLLSKAYYTLGAIAQITHQRGESLDLHAKMLVLRKSLKPELRDGDALLAHAYNEIGNDFMTDDEYDIALGFYNTSIKIYKNLGKYFKPSMLVLPRVNLGLAYWLQGDHEQAYSVVRDTLQEQEQELGPDDGVTMK